MSVTSKKDVSANASRDFEWSSLTCVYSWFTQGIFPEKEGLYVNAVCRSVSKQAMITGDEFGKINLYKFPAITKQQVHKEYLGHSAHITRARFAPDDTVAITVGGNDKCIFLWETDFGLSQ